ncbi:MAG: FtsX-like permease family protein [Oscillospiraceae bacterium]|nr:FtsX-like permease family protein [Oscillospiraceae bacterium]
MTRALFRDTLRSMRRTLPRFISIVIIVALGVGFFTGLRAVSPGMRAAAYNFFADLHLADIVIQSTVGFDEHDRLAVLELSGVENVTLSRFVDGILFDPPPEGEYDPVMAQGMTGAPYVMRVIGHDFEGYDENNQRSDRLNTLRLVEGRWPENYNEAVVSAYANRMDPQRFSVNQRILVRGDHENLLDTVRNAPGLEERHDGGVIYTIVGVVHSPEFLAMELGASQAGGGELSGYIYIPNRAFHRPYYTTLLIGVAGSRDHAPYTPEYDYLVRRVRESVEEEAQRILAQRTARIGPQLEEEIENGRIELEEARQQVEELTQALADRPAELEARRQELLAETSQERYDRLMAEFEQNLAEFEQARERYMVAHARRAAIPYSREDYIHAQNRMRTAQESWEMADMGLQVGRAAIETAESILESGDPARMGNAIAILSIYFPMNPGDATVEGVSRMLEEARVDMDFQEDMLEEARLDLERERAQLARFGPYLRELDAYEAARRDILEAETQMLDAQHWLNNADIMFAIMQHEFEQAERDLQIAVQEQNFGLQRIANSERLLRQAENLLYTLPYAQWMTNNRDHFPGYTNFGDTADSMQQFAIAFPILFFLVASLVSFSTMTRMVKDDRKQMGMLKAAGYSAASISVKYIFYAAAAGILGAILGTAIGFLFIPQAIFFAYQILYLIPNMPFAFFPAEALIGVAAALIATVGAVLASVVVNVRNHPSVLMRPKAPRVGKRVLLERVPFIWNRMGFTGKVTTRNLMRNKMRALMTFTGIMACTALLVVGFGIGDSLGTMLNRQFGPESIMRFDAQANLQVPMRAGDTAQLQAFDAHRQTGEITSILPAFIQQLYVDSAGFDRQVPARLSVPGDTTAFYDFIDLRDHRTGEQLQLTDDGAIINGKLAEIMDLQVGDTITLHWGLRQADVRVASITYNYIYHWIYVSPAYFEQTFGMECEFNMVLLNLNEDLRVAGLSGDALATAMEDRTALARELTDTVHVMAVAFNQTIIDSVGAQLNLMRNVVMVVFVAASGALAFVVLYNLNIINIYERIRELATIKVLGFSDKQTDMFIYRENIILSVLGIAAGLALGVPIFGYIIRQAEIESMMFVRTLVPWVFIAAGLVTLVFAIGINVVMHFRIKGINMVEALKSVE